MVKHLLETILCSDSPLTIRVRFTSLQTTVNCILRKMGGLHQSFCGIITSQENHEFREILECNLISEVEALGWQWIMQPGNIPKHLTNKRQEKIHITWTSQSSPKSVLHRRVGRMLPGKMRESYGLQLTDNRLNELPLIGQCHEIRVTRRPRLLGTVPGFTLIFTFVPLADIFVQREYL